MAIIREAADKIYEIKPEGEGLESFPLGTVYLIVDDNAALLEVGCPVQIPDILQAVDQLGYDIRKLSYIIPTHVHIDHAGGAGLLARKLPQTKVVAYSRAVKVLADSSILERMMQGFMHIYGDDAKERYGEMIPVAEERFVKVEDGDSIPLGHRELKVIHTPGHDPNHLCFLDTGSGGVFCGDALGAYFSEIEVLFTSPVPGSDPFLFLRSIEKLKKLKPELVFFSHGCATRDADKIIQSALDGARQCHDTAFEALRADKDQNEIACRLIEIMAAGSATARSDLSDWPYFIPIVVEGYRQYFKKNNMI
ncbi:MAG: MBL fold metallo-hydrolase [Desulfobacterales bacterium]|jgi:glyoxylase-like metal-dependent hydrolase (beta-lactamase superfamily II)